MIRSACCLSLLCAMMPALAIAQSVRFSPDGDLRVTSKGPAAGLFTEAAAFISEYCAPGFCDGDSQVDTSGLPINVILGDHAPTQQTQWIFPGDGIELTDTLIATGIPEHVMYGSSWSMSYAFGQSAASGNVSCLSCSAIVATDDQYSTTQGGLLDSSSLGLPTVLANDYLVGPGNDLFAYIIQGPKHGSLQFESDGSFTYQHNNSNILEDGFIYEAADLVNFPRGAAVTINIVPEPSLFHSLIVLIPWAAYFHRTVTMKCTGAGNVGLAQTSRDGLRHIIIPLRLRLRFIPAR